MQRNECVEVVLAELGRHGLTGEVETLSKHLQVNWVLPNGQKRFTTISKTASDHRSRLNSRGQVRRMLRQDFIEPVAPTANIYSFANAISRPKPVEPPHQRIERLEADVNVLLDWLVEAREGWETAMKEVQAFRSQLSNMRVTVSFDAGVPAPISADVPVEAAPLVYKKTRGKTQPEVVSEKLQPGRWYKLEEAIVLTGIPRNSLCAVLSLMKKNKKVESGQRGYWRLKPVEPEAVAKTG